MKFNKIILLEFSTFLKKSFIQIALFLFVLLLFLGSFSSILNFSPQMAKLFFFLIIMVFSYSEVFLFTTKFTQEKISNVYDRLFIFPVKPGILIILKLTPIIITSFIFTSILGLFLRSKLSFIDNTFLLMSLIFSYLFIIGLTLLVFSLIIQMGNPNILVVIMFVLVFLLVRVPNYVISKGRTVEFSFLIILIFTILIFVTGIIFLLKINPEKVVLS